MNGPIERCQSCGDSLREFLQLGYHPPPMVFPASRSNAPQTLYPLNVLRCRGCGLVQLGYAVDPEILFREYYYNSGATPSFKKHLEDLAERMMRELKPRFVVDIGSNDGTGLKRYDESGVKVLGVDPSTVAAKSTVFTINDFFNDELALKIVKQLGQADLITAFNIFAHIADLDSLMRGIVRLLKPKGVLLIEAQYLLDNLEKLTYDTMYLEHLRFYSLHTLISVLGRHDLEVFKAERIQTFGGSIRVFAHKKHGIEPPIEPSVAELLNLEDENGLQILSTYDKFAERVRQSKVDLNSLLWALMKQGHRIAGIGAPARSTTLINYCGLGPELIDYIVETSPLKIGRFSPGAHIPVMAEERLITDQPEYAVLFSIHLEDVIVPKLRAMGYKGKIVIPLPVVRVLE